MSTPPEDPRPDRGPDPSRPSEEPSQPGTWASGPTSASPRTPGTSGQEFFDRIRGFGLIRPDEDRWVAGVCAGISRRTGLDPLLVRGIFVAITVVGGVGLLAYGLLWAFLPHPDGRIHAQEVTRGVVTSGFVGAVLCVVFGLAFTDGPRIGVGGHLPLLFLNGSLIALLVVGGFCWWLVSTGRITTGQGPVRWRGAAGWEPVGQRQGQGATWGAGSAPQPTTPHATAAHPTAPQASPLAAPAASPAAQQWHQPRKRDVHAPSHALTLATLGIAMVAAAAVILVDLTVTPIGGYVPLVASATALGVVALGIILAGVFGRRSGGLAPIAVVLALVSINGAVVHGTVGLIGNRTWHPTSVSSAENGYDLGVGDAVLDLTDRSLATGSPTSPVEIQVRVGIGRLRVVVPNGVATQVRANVGAGDVIDNVTGGGRLDGSGVDRTITTTAGPAVLIIDAQTGVGSVEVLPQGTVVQP